MVWLKIEDHYFYDNRTELVKQLVEFKVHKDTLKKIEDDKIEFIFRKEELSNLLRGREYNKVIISPFSPKAFDMETSFFGEVNVPNRYGILTSSEKEAGLTEYQKLNKELSLLIEESPFTFENDMSGSEDLQDVVAKLNAKYTLGETPKAVFLAGLMGTGKSFWAQCFAGSTKRLLVSFNLAKIMGMENPIDAFDKIIDFLQRQNLKYVFWIDEIEKMFNGSEKSEHIKNKFLTFLNDLGMTIKMDAIVVMTANDVTDILHKNPEMLRGGRVEPFAKIFMDFLTLDSAIRMTEMYLSKRNAEKERRLRVAYSLIALAKDSLPSFLWINEHFDDEIKERAQKVLDRAKKEEVVTEDKLALYVVNLLEEILLDKTTEVVDDIIMDVTSEHIVDYIDRIYRIIHDSSINAYPYVPAEIKETVSQLFYAHMITKITPETIDSIVYKIVESNIAIGDAGREGVNKMLGNKDKFSIIIN